VTLVNHHLLPRNRAAFACLIKDLKLAELDLFLVRAGSIGELVLLSEDTGIAQILQSTVVREKNLHSLGDLLACFNDHVIQLLSLSGLSDFLFNFSSRLGQRSKV